MRISVIGLGKIGLPLAVQFASKGHHVTGVDIQQTVVDTINSGQEPFPGEYQLQEKLALRQEVNYRFGNQMLISRSADSGESEPWTTFSPTVRAKSPRMVPGVALETGSVPPAS